MNDAKELFLDLIELPEAERRERLEALERHSPELWRRVADLLAAHEESVRGLETTPVGGAFLAAAQGVGPRPGDTIDGYVLVEEIGEGGFGRVFLAEQERPVRRRVALKIIKLGMDTDRVVSRFASERQTLAMMDHPGIAKVHDAGTTKTGRPYFVMEYVEGVPITQFCEEQGLGVRERVALFHSVCLAVRHAHQKAVLHRDIKPANVLVGRQDGRAVAKVIDFGISKALGEASEGTATLTFEGELVGTPAYMSPEQVAGLADIDTRSDVYALGALLYELLVGATVFDLSGLSIPELQQKILEEDPPRPSRRARLASSRDDGEARTTTIGAADIPRDLDWICQRCLEKDRARRYGGVSALADDVRRFLDDEPVEAAPPDAGYRLRKFVRRHRLLVAGAAAAAAATLVAGAGLYAGLLRAREAEAQARREARTAERTSEFLSDLLAGLDPETVGRELLDDLHGRVADARRRRGASAVEAAAARAALTDALRDVNATDVARGVLDRALLAGALETIDRELADEPLIAARLRQTIGNGYERYGLLEKADEQLGLADTLVEEELGVESGSSLVMDLDRANLLQRQGRAAEAEALLAGTAAAMRELHGPEDSRTLNALGSLASARWALGRYAEAEELYGEVWEVSRRVRGELDPTTLSARLGMGLTNRAQGRSTEALRIYTEVLAGQDETLGPDHADTIRTLGNLANVLSDLGRYEEAAARFGEALERRLRILGEAHPSTLQSMNNLARTFERSGRLEEAEALWLDVLDLQPGVVGEDDPRRYLAKTGLATIHTERGEYAEAEELLLEVLDAWRAAKGPEYRDTLWVMNALAQVYLGQERFEEADALLRETLEVQRRVMGAEHGDTLATLNNLGSSYVRQERYEEAAAAFEETLRGKRESLGPRHPSTVRVLYNLACLSAIQGREDEARAWLADAVEHGYSNHEQLAQDPDLDALREDASFAALLEKAHHNAMAE